MSEAIMIGLLSLGPLCWMLGGTYAKWIRRNLWPGLAGGLLLLAHQPWGRCGLVGVTLWFSTLLPYGDRAPWSLRVIVFFLLPMPALYLTWKVWWLVVLAGGLITWLAWMSRRFNWFTHKFFEAGAGFLQATCLILAVLLR